MNEQLLCLSCCLIVLDISKKCRIRTTLRQKLFSTCYASLSFWTPLLWISFVTESAYPGGSWCPGLLSERVVLWSLLLTLLLNQGSWPLECDLLGIERGGSVQTSLRHSSDDPKWKGLAQKKSVVILSANLSCLKWITLL